jgi:poly-beta-1,6 N-acetyl-D-glucosamine synthase
MSAVAGWQARLELSLTQAALASAAAIHTGLFRPPYSSGTGSISASQFRAWQAVASQGYLIALANRDSEDWRRPGVAQILANARPVGAGGTVVLFHDGGGDRSQTVAALGRYISTLQATGYRFTTVTGLAGLPSQAGDRRVGLAARLGSRIIAVTALTAHTTTTALRVALLFIGLLTIARAVGLLLIARHHVRAPERARDDHSFAPPVSIVVPAYNEAAGIEAAVRSLAGAAYPHLEVIVVDDGSTDETATIVESLHLDNVRLVRQANSGKPAALNTGVAAARHDVIVTVDGDTVFEPETVRWLVQPFADATVGAVSGNTKVANRGGILGRWQHIEYVMGFNLDRRVYDVLGCMPTVPGAIGAFRRHALHDAGGVSGDTLAEDTDVTMAIVRAGWRVVYEERARAWTEAPASLSAMWKQRYRWSYGTMQAMWKHRRSAIERGPLGRRALPYMLGFQILLPLLAPIVDLYALYGLVFLQPLPVIGFWVGFNLVGLGVAWFAFRLDHEPARPLWALVFQQFVYRQLMYLVVIQSVSTALIGSTLRWHKLARTGDFSAVSTANFVDSRQGLVHR